MASSLELDDDLQDDSNGGLAKPTEVEPVFKVGLTHPFIHDMHLVICRSL